MEINYELTSKDLIKYAKEIAPSQKSHQPMVISFTIMYLAFIFADVIYALFAGTLKDWKFRELMANIGLRTVITFAAIVVVLGIINLITRKKAKDLAAEPENGVFGEHRIILNEKELVELTNVNTSRYAWKAIGEVKELENFVLINIVMSSTYIIPKRYFEDRAQIKKFIETADYHRQNAGNAFQPAHFIEYEKSLE